MRRGVVAQHTPLGLWSARCYAKKKEGPRYFIFYFGVAGVTPVVDQAYYATRC